ncbi:hypothetical protein JXA47_10725 [Candidatus Sumerlaeota bacterium]|nr:hypothetical protein [Candidatus Sumerlaeota bacterium]
MEPRTDIILFVCLAVALFVVLAVFGILAERRRRQALSAWAASTGLRFRPVKDRSIDNRFPAFSCLRSGSNRYAQNLMEGDWSGRWLLAFDYHCETHSRDSKGRRQTHHHHFSCAIIGSDVPLEPLRIRPEGFFDRLTEFFGFDDIDFESAEFSRRFHVKAPDRRWAFDVLHQRTMEFLLEMPRFTIQFDRACVLVHRATRFSPDDFGVAADVASGILDRLPEYVVRQQRGEE